MAYQEICSFIDQQFFVFLIKIFSVRILLPFVKMNKNKNSHMMADVGLTNFLIRPGLDEQKPEFFHFLKNISFAI